jgi:hypothetical protein
MDPKHLDVMDARARVMHYLAMRKAVPMTQMGDPIHAIHTGSEYEAELLLSDLQLLFEEETP